MVPDPEVRRFQAMAWADEAALTLRYEATLRRDPAEVLMELDRAYARDDVKTIVVAGQVLAQDRAFRAMDALRIGERLVKLSRFDDALQMFDHRVVRGTESLKRYYWKAKALAGAGHLEQARDAADRAASIAPDFPKAAALREAVAAAIAVGARPDLATKPGKVCRAVRALSAAGLKTPARALLERFMQVQSAGAAEASEPTPELLGVAELALDLLGPAAAHAFLTANAARLPDGERRAALLMRCEAALGRPAADLPDRSPDGAPQPPEGRDMATARAFALETAGDLKAAIPILGQVAADHPKDPEVRRSLARCIGHDVLKTVRPRFTTGGPRRIVNLLPFYNEIGMFRMRLQEMADWVDHFVVIEAAKTFTGLDKPLIFDARKAEFAPFAHQITHLALDEFPAHVRHAWSRDFHQRDMAVRGLAGLCGADDLILLTDADEIVDRRAIEGFDGDCAALEMSMFKYFLNYRPVAGQRKRALVKSSIWRAAYLEEFGSSYLRFYMAKEKSQRVIPHAGWHFTSMMDPAEVARKVNSYAHQEHLQVQTHDEARYQDLLGRIRRGEPEPGWERCEVDDSFPAFVRDHQDELARLLI